MRCQQSPRVISGKSRRTFLIARRFEIGPTFIPSINKRSIAANSTGVILPPFSFVPEHWIRRNSLLRTSCRARYAPPIWILVESRGSLARCARLVLSQNAVLRCNLSLFLRNRTGETCSYVILHREFWRGTLYAAPRLEGMLMEKRRQSRANDPGCIPPLATLRQKCSDPRMRAAIDFLLAHDLKREFRIEDLSQHLNLSTSRVLHLYSRTLWLHPLAGVEIKARVQGEKAAFNFYEGERGSGGGRRSRPKPLYAGLQAEVRSEPVRAAETSQRKQPTSQRRARA